MIQIKYIFPHTICMNCGLSVIDEDNFTNGFSWNYLPREQKVHLKFPPEFSYISGSTKFRIEKLYIHYTSRRILRGRSRTLVLNIVIHFRNDFK